MVRDSSLFPVYKYVQGSMWKLIAHSQEVFK